MPDIFEELKEIESKIEEEKKLASEPEPEPAPAPTPEPEPADEPDPKDADPEPTPAPDTATDDNKAKTAAYEERKSKRLERELDEHKRLLAAAMAARQQPEPPKVSAGPARPDPQLDPDAARDYDLAEMRSELTELRNERMKEAALKEFVEESQKLVGEVPDVKEVIDAGFDQIVRASMLFNPNIGAMAAQDAAKRSILSIAIQAVGSGKNPALAVYEHFRARGVSAPAKTQTVEKVSETKKLEAVMRNKPKSGSPLTGGGTSARVPITTQRKLEMTPGEFFKLSPEEQASFANIN